MKQAREKCEDQAMSQRRFKFDNSKYGIKRTLNPGPMSSNYSVSDQSLMEPQSKKRKRRGGRGRALAGRWQAGVGSADTAESPDAARITLQINLRASAFTLRLLPIIDWESSGSGRRNAPDGRRAPAARATETDQRKRKRKRGRGRWKRGRGRWKRPFHRFP